MASWTRPKSMTLVVFGHQKVKRILSCWLPTWMFGHVWTASIEDLKLTVSLTLSSLIWFNLIWIKWFPTEEQDCIGRKSGYSNDYEWFSYNQVWCWLTNRMLLITNFACRPFSKCTPLAQDWSILAVNQTIIPWWCCMAKTILKFVHFWIL